MTPAQRLDDYEKSCLYAGRMMRLAGIREGKYLPQPDDPEEVAAHREYLERQPAEARGR